MRVLQCAPLVTAPLLVKTLRGVSTLAMVADSRAMGINQHPTTLQQRRTRPADRFAACALAAVAVGSIIVIVLGGGRG